MINNSSFGFSPFKLNPKLESLIFNMRHSLARKMMKSGYWFVSYEICR